MRYGLLLLGAHPPDQLLKLASLAEAHDFEHLWYADEKFYRDPYVSLTYLAQHTSRIKLGTCVTDPYTRHPALVAMEMGTLAELAGGRAVLGIGAGFSGLRALGTRQTKPVAALREAIELIRRLWAGETVTYEGETVTFHGGELNFEVEQQIPILIATSGRQILRLAGEVSDAVMLGDLGSAPVINQALAEVQRGASRVERSLDGVPLISRVNLILSEDAEAARNLMKPWIAIGLWYKYPNWDYFFYHDEEWEDRLQPLKAFIENHGGKPRNVGDYDLISSYTELITDEMVRHSALAGTVDDVVHQIVEIADTGITQIALYPMPLPGQSIELVLDAFVKDVMPRAQAVLGEP